MRILTLLTTLALNIVPATLPGQAVAGCFLSSYGGSAIESLSRRTSSGRNDIDAHVRREVALLNRAFAVRPGLTYFQEPRSMGQNALATTTQLFGERTDGTVLLGVNLLRSEYRNAGWSWVAPISGIMAHEWAHIWQFTQPNIRAMPVPWRELHADFLAGWYMGMRFQDGLEFDSRTFSKSLYDKGDFAFFHPDHHGVPAQRDLIMTEGLFYAVQTGERSLLAAAQAGADLIYMEGGRPHIRIRRSLRDCAPNC